MKSFKILATAALLAVSASASAQFTNTSTTGSTSSAKTDGWSTIYVEYNPVKLNFDISGADDESLTGFSFGYTQAFPVSVGTPIFIETGIGVQYAYKNDFQDTDDFNFSLISAKVPVNLAYKISLSNSSTSIIPFAGITARYNIVGKFKYDGGSKDYDWDVFDKKDMEDLELLDEKAWKRLQLGWQIGVKARINDSFLVGLSYGSDFSEIAKKVKVSTTSITIGYTF